MNFTAREAWQALRIPGRSKQERIDLLWLVAEYDDWNLAEKVLSKKLCTGLTGQQKLEAKFSAILQKRKLPRLLVCALETNPIGKAKAKLLETIRETAASSDKALHSKAKLSVGEAERLAWRALATSNYEYRYGRSCRILEEFTKRHLVMSSGLRSTCLRWATVSWYGLSTSVLREPEKYFPPAAPMTKEERSLLFENMLLQNCTSVLKKDHFSFHDEEHPLVLSKDETDRLISAALSKEKLEMFSPYTAEEILEGPFSAALNPEQREMLGVIAKKAT